MGYIYLVTNVLTGKQYVGQTTRLDINTRWNQHKKVCKTGLGRYIRAAYCKYGIDTFKFEIICVCFDDDCDRYEDEYIIKYGTLAPNGYNLRAGGGNNGKHHPDTIKLMSERLKGRKARLPKSDETRRKLSEGLKGSKNPNYGKKISEEQKAKARATRKERLENGQRKYVMSEASLLNLLKGRKSGRKVMQFTINDEHIATYESATQASIHTGVPACCIRNVINPKRSHKTAGGFIWKVYTG